MPDRDAEFTLSANDRTRGATESSARGFEKVSDSADKATRKIDDLGDETGQLTRQMVAAKLAAAALAREFDKTGDSKLLKDFNRINREASNLSKVMKTLKFDAPEVKTSSGMFGGFVKFARQAGLIGGEVAVEGFADAFKALPGPVKVAVVGAVVAAGAVAAPILAGALQGAVLAGVATGGIAGGLILGAKDPHVVEEYSLLGSRINAKLQDSVTKPFAQQMLQAAPKLGAAFDQEEPRLRRIASNLAATLGPIVDKGIEAVHRIMPSIERASAVGGTILKSIAAQLPALAGSVGKLMDAFAAGGPGAAAAIGLIIYQLRGLINLLAFGAQASAPFLNFFGKLAEAGNFVPRTTGTVSELSTIVHEAGTNAMFTTAQMQAMNNALGNTADKANAVNEAFSRMFNEEMGVQQANLAVNMGMLALTETLKGNKKTLDQNTEAGTQNAAVILQQIQNLEQKRQADIAAGNGTAEATARANAAYASQVGALRQLLISMGFTAAAVDNLIGRLYAIPTTITTTITTVWREVGTPRAPGYGDAKTGHSRTGSTDYSGLNSWRPAQFAYGHRMQLASEPGGGAVQPPTQVHSELALTVELDGVPFRTMAARTTRAAEKRQAWRARVGARR